MDGRGLGELLTQLSEQGGHSWRMWKLSANSRRQVSVERHELDQHHTRGAVHFSGVSSHFSRDVQTFPPVLPGGHKL